MSNKILRLLGVLLGCSLFVIGFIFLISNLAHKNQEVKFGAGYSPVTGFQTLTTSRVSAADTVIPVASVTDKAGNTIVPSNISSSSTIRMYFNFEAGSVREEPFYCTGISGLSLTGCVRGISFQGSDLTPSSTIAQIHNAGASVIMTNLGVMYGNELVGTSGNQTVFDTKTFNSLPKTTSTTAIPTSNDQLTPWYAAQSLVAGGLSSLNVSSTRGLIAYTGLTNCSTSGTCVAVNASSTGAINFYPSTGTLYVGASSTANDVSGGYLKYTNNVLNQLYWDAPSFLSGVHTWGGNNTFSSGVFVNTISRGIGTGLAANDVALNQAVSNNEATGTTGIAVTAGQALYMSSTSTLFQTNSSVASSTYQFVGIAANSAVSGATVFYTKPGGINCSQTALSPGIKYYLSGSTGGIAITPGTFNATIGQATSATCIEVSNPKFIKTGSFFMTGTTGASSTQIGFYPVHIELRAYCAGGMSLGDESNTSIYSGNNASVVVAGGDASNAVHCFPGSLANFAGTISSRDSTSFTTTLNSGPGASSVVNFEYVAYSE